MMGVVRTARSRQRIAVFLFAYGLACLVLTLLTHNVLWPVSIFTMAASVFTYRLNQIILRRERNRQSAARR
jgi:hypothetical protein